MFDFRKLYFLKYIYITFLCICLNFYQIKATTFNTNAEEISKLEVSSAFLVQKDSLLKIKYNLILKLKNNVNYASALEKALELYDESQNNDDYHFNYDIIFLIADIYERTNNFSESLKYYKKSIAIINSIALKETESKFLNNKFTYSLLKVGSSYHKLSNAIDLSGSLNQLDSLKLEKLKLSYIDSAKLYYKKIENLSELNIDLENIKATAFSNLSAIYERDSILDIAENYARKAIKLQKNNNNYVSTARALNNLGNIYLSKKEYQKSKETYLEALELIKNDNNPRAFKTKADLYYNLAWVMRNLKDYKAYDFQEKSYEIEGDIREKEFRGIIEEVTHRYDFNSQKEILEQKQEVMLLKEKDKAKNITFFGLLIFISLLVVIGYFDIRRKNLELKLKETELTQSKNLEKLKSDSQARILDATINGKESERKQIAESLHDNVSALLSSANLHLQATRKQFKGSIPPEIDKTQQIINEASDKIRDLSHNLVSSVLLKFGLTFAVKDVAEKYSNSDLKIIAQIENIRRYDQSFEIKIYNILQELINNIIKHSKASEAIIYMQEENEKIILKIRDNGVGFDKTNIQNKDGLGINQINARIQMLAGTFLIDSSENIGTKIQIQIPVVKLEETSYVSPIL